MTEPKSFSAPPDTKRAFPTSKNSSPLQVAVQEEIVHFAGYPPEVLEKFEKVLEGSAEKLLENMLQESEFRRKMEEKALDSNIATQEDFRKYNLQSIANERYGQIMGFIVCLACIGSAVYLGAIAPGSWKIPVAITAIPTAAVIWAFRGKFNDMKKGGQNGGDTPNA